MVDVKVSICVAYFNRSEFALDCVQSLLDQDYESFEVVVVNDGSPDQNTAKVLDSFNDPRLKVIHQENTGFVGAIRRAISESSGEYIAIMGAGDVCHPSRISQQAKVLDEKADIGIVSCLFENVVVGGEHNGNREKRDYPNIKINANSFLNGANPIGHGEVMFRRSLYDQVGGYRPFFKFSQDLDLWLRMIDHCEVHLIREYLYERRMFMSDGVSTDPKKQFLQKYLAEFSRQCYRDKHTQGKDFVELYGFHAGFFKAPSKPLGELSTSLALTALKKKDYEDARYFIKLAGNEAHSFKYAVVKQLVKLSGSNWGKSLLNAAFGVQSKIKPSAAV